MHVMSRYIKNSNDYGLFILDREGHWPSSRYKVQV